MLCVEEERKLKQKEFNESEEETTENMLNKINDLQKKPLIPLKKM